MQTVRTYIFTFMFGAIGYGLIEILYRGRTHWTMTIAGGIIFSLLYLFNKKMQPIGLLGRSLVGCIVITLLELCIGCVVNRWMHMAVWDYSGLPLNVMGQICPGFSGLWFLLCLPVDLLCGFLHRNLFSNQEEKYP